MRAHVLALRDAQVDAALNNGAWGAPALDRAGRCVGMALQKFSAQTWMERYDESLGGAYGDDDHGAMGDDDAYDGDYGGGGGAPGGPGQARAGHHSHCIPLLQHALRAVPSRVLEHGR